MLRAQLIFFTSILTLSSACSESGTSRAYPEPGSDAAQYCDTNETGPGTVGLPNGERYEKKCLKAYSWEN